MLFRSIRFTDDRKRYQDIEKILNSPAYVRRKVRLTQEVTKVEDVKRSVVKSSYRVVDMADNSQRVDVDVTSLFDQVK